MNHGNERCVRNLRSSRGGPRYLLYSLFFGITLLPSIYSYYIRRNQNGVSIPCLACCCTSFLATRVGKAALSNGFLCSERREERVGVRKYRKYHGLVQYSSLFKDGDVRLLRRTSRYIFTRQWRQGPPMISPNRTASLTHTRVCERERAHNTTPTSACRSATCFRVFCVLQIQSTGIYIYTYIRIKNRGFERVLVHVHPSLPQEPIIAK